MPVRRLGLLVAFVLLAVLALPARAAAPEGPRLTIVVDSLVDKRWPEMISVSPTGGDRVPLILDAGSDRPSWSADGKLLAVGAQGAGWEGSVVAVDDADASKLRIYRRAPIEVGEPVISPDGRFVAFGREALIKVLPGRENYLIKSSIWLLNVEHGRVRPLTPWRRQTFLSPSSFSPDGSNLAATMFSRRGLNAVAIGVESGKFTLLARDAIEPTYSPDGSRFAFVRYLNWRLNGVNERQPARDELRVGRVGKVNGARLLLRRRGFFSSPSWDPSGRRLAFIHSKADEIGDRSPEEGNRLMAINADGTCLTRVLSEPNLIVYGSAWQPGPGREAGPIVC